MYSLKTPNHQFDVIKIKTRPNEYYYTLKNLTQPSRACMDVLVWKNDEEWWAAIEYLEYDSACSSNNLERKSGTIEMVQGMLSALLKKHPKITTVELSDKSNFIASNNERIPLPEYRMITTGKTWYEEHFGAIPANDSVVDRRRRYLKERKELHKQLLEMPKLTAEDFKEFLRASHLRQLSGNVWVIPIDAIKVYPIEGHLKKVAPHVQGGFQGLLKREEFEFRLYG